MMKVQSLSSYFNHRVIRFFVRGNESFRIIPSLVLQEKKKDMSRVVARSWRIGHREETFGEKIKQMVESSA